MGGMIAVLQSREVSGVFFAVSVVFSVCSLELLRLWLERRTGRMGRRTGVAAAALGLVFLAMTVGGIAINMAVGRLAFLGLGLLLTGTASLGILIELTVRMRRGDDEEMRRLAAQDL